MRIQKKIRRRLLGWVPLCLTTLTLAAPPALGQPSRRPLPPLSDFAVIEEKNLFHPDRIPQLPSPQAKQPAAGAADIARTNFVLHGVILYDNGPSLALLQEPRLTDKKVKSLAQGDKIGPYVLKAIKRDRVVMALGDNEFEVVLYKTKKTKPPPKRPATSTSSRPRPKRLTKPSPTRPRKTTP
jgi:type II secretory pathway component PulC